MDDQEFVESALRDWSTAIEMVSWTAMPKVTNPIWQVAATDGRSYVLKLLPEYPPGAGPVDEFRVLCHLQKRGIPVALPVVTDEGRIHTTVDGRLVALLPMLPSSADDHEFGADPTGTAFDVGRAIGVLDEVLNEVPWTIKSFSDDDPAGSLDGLAALPDEVRLQVEPWGDRLRHAVRDLPTQLTHGDCNTGNVLIDRGRVSGFLDFDHLPSGPRVRDLVSYLVSRLRHQLVRQNGEAGDIRAWGGAFPSYLAGYHDACSLTAQEINAVVPLMLLVEVGGAHWCLHGWEPNPEGYQMNRLSIAWLVEHFEELSREAQAAIQDRVTPTTCQGKPR